MITSWDPMRVLHAADHEIRRAVQIIDLSKIPEKEAKVYKTIIDNWNTLKEFEFTYIELDDSYPAQADFRFLYSDYPGGSPLFTLDIQVTDAWQISYSAKGFGTFNTLCSDSLEDLLYKIMEA